MNNPSFPGEHLPSKESAGLNPSVNATQAEMLSLLSESISARTGKQVVLTDIMQYNQYRREVDENTIFVDKRGNVIPRENIVFDNKEAA